MSAILQCVVCCQGVFDADQDSARMTRSGLMCGPCHSQGRSLWRLHQFPKHLVAPEVTTIKRVADGVFGK